jgi:RNA polymerase sigma-70 factor (ECF subfamily)
MDLLHSNCPDDQLLLLMQQGNEAAFAILYQRYLNLLFNKACYHLGDPDEARDVTQEVLIWLWKNGGRVEITTTLKAYLMGAVQQRCADALRKKANRNNRQEVYASLAATITGTSPLETKELGSQLEAALELVAPTSRKAFMLSYIEKMSLKEIAVAMNIQVQTAKNHIHQALKILRQQLQKN